MVRQIFTGKTLKRIRRVVRAFEGDGGGGGRNRKATPAPGGRQVGLGIVQETISVNTSGDFKFAKGTKGSETAYGKAYDGYYRGDPAAGAITAGKYVYYTWIVDGYDISPVICPTV